MSRKSTRSYAHSVKRWRCGHRHRSAATRFNTEQAHGVRRHPSTQRQTTSGAIGIDTRRRRHFRFQNDAIIWMSKGGSILGWSKGAERMYGSSEAEILGRSLSLLISLDRMLSYTCPATATKPRAFKGWFGKTNHSPWQSCDAKCDRHFGVLSRNELLLLDSQDLRRLVAIQHKKSDWADRRSIRVSMVIRMLQVGCWPNPRSMSSLSMPSATCGLLHLSL